MNSRCIPLGFLLVTFFAIIPSTFPLENKYTKEANVQYRELEKPFRISKLNLVWQKAVLKLTDTKLRSLYTDLQYQDKEEIKLKRIKADGLDKDGLKEAEVRRKFKGILNSFGLIEFFEEGALPHKQTQDDQHKHSDNHINKSLFKDKKLNKLWEKAERGGFNEKELKTLKEEFLHHQEKIDEYYMLLETLTPEDERNDMLNDIARNQLLEDSEDPLPKDKKADSSVNDVRTKHREIKDGYDYLHKKSASGPSSLDFTEPRVQNLWKMALNGDFTPDELNSLQVELKHYEKRVEKLQHLHAEYLVKDAHYGKTHLHTEKDVNSLFADKIKRHERSVEKLHADLENKILNRHIEL